MKTKKCHHKHKDFQYCYICGDIAFCPLKLVFTGSHTHKLGIGIFVATLHRRNAFYNVQNVYFIP